MNEKNAHNFELNIGDEHGNFYTCLEICIANPKIIDLAIWVLLLSCCTIHKFNTFCN